MANGLDIFIITGLSGSGKSFAIRALEDNGFFCIDNLPAPLIPKFVELCQGHQEDIMRIALGVDLRGSQFLQSLPEVLADCAPRATMFKCYFSTLPMTCCCDVSVKPGGRIRWRARNRFKTVFRGNVKRLESIRALADKVIDTSDFNVHQLKREMEQQFCEAPSARRMALFLTSFGYKFGIPHDTDIILDVRFLPNPYFVNELRDKSGLDREVEEYVLGNAETRARFSTVCTRSWNLLCRSTSARAKAA